MDKNQESNKRPVPKKLGMSVGIGLALGTAFGLDIENLPVCVGADLSLGAAIGAMLTRKNR